MEKQNLLYFLYVLIFNICTDLFFCNLIPNAYQYKSSYVANLHCSSNKDSIFKLIALSLLLLPVLQMHSTTIPIDFFQFLCS